MNNIILLGIWQEIPRTIDCMSRIYSKESFDIALRDLNETIIRKQRSQRKQKLEKINKVNGKRN